MADGTEETRLIRLEVEVAFLKEKLTSLAVEWKDVMENHTAEEIKNVEKINKQLEMISGTLVELTLQTTKWKGTVGGVMITVTFIVSILSYLANQAGFSLGALFRGGKGG